MKRTLTVVGGIAGAVALIPALYFGGLFLSHGGSRDFLAIDSCLDAGGRWNYETRTCERSAEERETGSRRPTTDPRAGRSSPPARAFYPRGRGEARDTRMSFVRL